MFIRELGSESSAAQVTKSYSRIWTILQENLIFAIKVEPLNLKF